MAEYNTDSTGEKTTDKLEKLSQAVAQKADRIKYTVLAALVVVIAALALFGYLRRSKAARETEAQNKVFQSVMELQRNPETADAKAAFGKAAKDYAGTSAGAQAQRMQFAYAYNTRDYATAEQASRDFIKQYPDNSFVNRAQLALGQSLMQQEKIGDAISTLREVARKNDPEIFPEAKLALAQALERDAENVKDSPDEYHSRLETALAEYSDIISRSRISSPLQRGFWPQAVILAADLSLVQIKDRLGGHTHSEPVGTQQEITEQDRQGVMNIPPPTAGTEGTVSDSGIAAGSAADRVAETKDAIAEALSKAAEAAKHTVTDAVDSAKDAAIAAREAVSQAVNLTPEKLADYVTDTRKALDTAAIASKDALSRAANGAIDSLNRATMDLADKAGSARDILGNAAKNGFDAVSQTADKAKVSIDTAVKAAGESIDKAVDSKLDAKEIAEQISGHLADTRTLFESAAKSGSDAISQASDKARSTLEDAVKDRHIELAKQEVQEAARVSGAELDQTVHAAITRINDASTKAGEQVGSEREAIDAAGRSGVEAINKAIDDAKKSIDTSFTNATDSLGEKAGAMSLDDFFIRLSTRLGEAKDQIIEEGKKGGSAILEAADKAHGAIDAIIRKNSAPDASVTETVAKAGDAAAKALESLTATAKKAEDAAESEIESVAREVQENAAVAVEDGGHHVNRLINRVRTNADATAQEVMRETSHEGEEYVKASEAGMAPAAPAAQTTEAGEQVEVTSHDFDTDNK